jgi:uncharacterized protein DUF6980
MGVDTLNNGYCCTIMQGWLQDIDCPLIYNKFARYYTMSAPKSLIEKNVVWPCYKVHYCPYCGTQLPKDLVDEWMNILENEYNIDDPYDSKQKKLIPKEFKTDEWWKKRGL